MKKRQRLLSILIILALVFIWGNSLLSKPASKAISDIIVNALYAIGEKLGISLSASEATEEALDTSTFFVRKAAHLTEFAVLAALIYLRLETTGKKRILTAFLCAAAVGAIDETIQIFSHRGSQIRDVFIDAAGALLGLLIILLFLRRKKPK